MTKKSDNEYQKAINSNIYKSKTNKINTENKIKKSKSAKNSGIKPKKRGKPAPSQRIIRKNQETKQKQEQAKKAAEEKASDNNQ